MVQLILIKHGQTEWDKEKRVQGALDIPLNAEGEKEAKKISVELSKLKIDNVYSSPVSCSISTATEIAMPHKIKIKKLNELNELNHGVWQGLRIKDIKRRYKKQYNIWKISPTSGKPPKGESVRDAYDRAVSVMHKIVDKHKNENTCVVSGGIILSLIKCYIKNADIENIWKFTPEKAWWEVFKL